MDLEIVKIYSNSTLLGMHADIVTCLDAEDKNPSATKLHFVRSRPDWRCASDAIEAELSKRGIQHLPIQW